MEELKPLLWEVAPRLRSVTLVGTHVARRTGASLHILEGWAERTAMYVGGWENIKEFEKYLVSIETVTELDARAQATGVRYTNGACKA